MLLPNRQGEAWTHECSRPAELSQALEAICVQCPKSDKSVQNDVVFVQRCPITFAGFAFETYSRMMHRVLLVDPQHLHLTQLVRALRDVAVVKQVDNFLAGRAAILDETPPDLLITNLRLGPYNGIHLVLLAGMSHTRCIVYAKQHDLVLARQIQTAGAFYVPLEQLPFALPTFLTLQVPQGDRRDPAVRDRRKTFRGGRRRTDVKSPNAAFQRGAFVGLDPRRH